MKDDRINERLGIMILCKLGSRQLSHPMSVQYGKNFSSLLYRGASISIVYQMTT